MATIYTVNLKVCSEWCGYPEKELEELLEKIIEDWRDELNHYQLLVSDMKVKILR